jgi:hypothetical protein
MGELRYRIKQRHQLIARERRGVEALGEEEDLERRPEAE